MVHYKNAAIVSLSISFGSVLNDTDIIMNWIHKANEVEDYSTFLLSVTELEEVRWTCDAGG